MKLSHRLLSPILLLTCLLGLPMPTAAQDPATLQRLRLDQEEILRKTERLRALMERLLQRYEREGKTEQVQLLQQGLQHLESSGLLRDVAQIRDDLSATAFGEALRKQQAVVEQLEQLLNILLARQSVKNLSEALRTATEQAATAAELAQRQRDLQNRTQQALQGEPSAPEQQLTDAMRDLAQQQRSEAERNARESGLRRPFLENALQRVQELLRQQDRLESALADQAQNAADAARERQFDLGELVQRAGELTGQLREEQRTNELRAAAQELREQANGADAQAQAAARDRFAALLDDAPKLPGGSEGPQRDAKWSELRQALQKLPEPGQATAAEALQQFAERAVSLGDERAAQARQRNQADSERLALQSQKLAQALQPDPAAAQTEKAVQRGNQATQASQAAGQAGDLPRSQQHAEAALAAFEQARKLDREQHPRPDQQAAAMAAESASTANELRNAPDAKAAEATAAEQLKAAEQSLRETAAQAANEQPTTSTANARANLAAARDTLTEALAKEQQGREAEFAQAQARQQQLQEQAKQLQEQVHQAQQGQQLAPAQAEAAQAALQAAQQSMANAEQQLAKGQQASASAQQQRAAEQLEAAASGTEQQRPTTQAQREQLRQQSQQQAKLAEDILKLAEELRQRDNQRAQRAAEDAAQAAQRAQQAMDRGDEAETPQQQQAAREQLERAQRELQEEVDRYQDLRQEELLFKMKEELTALLAAQQPLTAQTLQLQQQLAAGLARPARRAANQVGEEELALAGKLEFLIQALTDEGNLVYRAVLNANLEDLREVATRMQARSPDPGPYTTLLQQDVERRTSQLLQALERERKRREQERQQQQQQQQQQQAEQSQNRFNQQRQMLVSLIAELEMLKQLGQDTQRATDDLKTLIELRGDDTISDAETALIERLAHRHAEITKLFVQIRAGVEQAMQAGSANPTEPGETGR